MCVCVFVVQASVFLNLGETKAFVYMEPGGLWGLNIPQAPGVDGRTLSKQI